MTKKFKDPSIKYTSRDFNTIREDLIEHAKRYYPDTFRDFNEASFGALMVDAVAYIGDMLSFYLDYQANESFLTTANEYNNILKHGKALGYRLESAPSSYGIVTLYVRVPAATSGLGVDSRYMPILKSGTMFGTSRSGFMLVNDVDFANPANQTVVAAVNKTTGAPTEYAIKAYGEVVSGRYNTRTIGVGNFERFKRVDLREPNLTEILSVIDSEGNRYYEVDYLSQNTIYRSVANTGANSNTVPNLLKPFVAMRRFVIESEQGRNYLQFGYGSEDNYSNEGFLKPENIIMKRHGRDYVKEQSFDPGKMINSDKFGISPSNTILTVAYRTNDASTVNAAVGSISDVRSAIFGFKDTHTLNAGVKGTIIDSLEVTNEQPVVGDVTYPSSDEVKRRIFDSFTSQHRAVTAQDYKALIYMLPSKFGSIKRCNILQDPDEFKRNLNIYVVSENHVGNLTKTNNTIKNNLKNWINQYRMINDTIDILDAKIINIGIDFTIVAQLDTDKFTVLRLAEDILRQEFRSIGEISESINLSDIYRLLNQVEGVSDTIDVTMVRKTSAAHSSVDFNVERALSFDGRYLVPPEDAVFEIRYLDTDIKGTVR